MRLGGVVSPSPSPAYSNDPFNPDVTIWPEAPDWLFPAVMIALAISVAVVVTLIVLWRKAVVEQRKEREAQGPTQWVDLSKLDKKGHWEDDGPALDSDAEK
jgi:hypothetical protein